MKQFRVVRVDDLDGKKAVDTVRFSYQGKGYEIDLSAANRQRFDRMMREFISKARPRSRHTVMRSEPMKVRTWARDHGLKVGSRGRIPSSVMSEYRKAKRNKVA